MSVHFHHQTPSRLCNKKKLKSFLEDLFKKEGTGLETLNFIFCTDDYLLKINSEFLGHDYYTDIITFNLAPPKQPVIGDIYISIDRVKENAKALNQSFKNEILRVIFHGALHLCGYKDKNTKQIRFMRDKEDYYLKLIRS